MKKIALVGAALLAAASLAQTPVDATSDEPLKKRKTKVKTTGAERAAKRLDDQRKATAKRLKNAPEDLDLSRQVRRQMERRAKKMPISLSQAMWHRANEFPKLGGRAA